MARDTEVFTLTGLKETLDGLKQFDKSAVTKFNKVINEELAIAKFKAVASIPLVPMSGWKSEAFGPQRERVAGVVPKWNAGKAKAGIRLTKSERRVRRDYTTSAGAVVQGDAAGAIFEVAGRKTSGSGTGVQFIKNLNRFKQASRAVWSAVDSERADIERKVHAALEEAKATLQKHLNSQKG